MPKIIKKKLERELLGVLFILSLLVFGTLAIVDIRRVTHNMLEQESKKIELMAITMRKSIQDMMVTGNAPIVGGWVNDLKEIEQARSIQVLRKDGTEAFRDNKTIEEVNRFIGRETFLKTYGDKSVGDLLKPDPIDNARFEKVLDTGNKVTYLETLNGTEVMTQLTPIANEERCASCHGFDKHKVRAVLRVSVPVSGVRTTIKYHVWEILFIYLIAVFITAIILKVVIRVIAIQPIKSILEATKALSQSNLAMKVDINALKSDNEISELALSFNNMADSLEKRTTEIHMVNDELKSEIYERKQAEEAIKRYSQNLERLLLFSSEITTTTDLKKLYRKMITYSKEFLKLDFSTLLILSKDKTLLTVQDTIGFPESMSGTLSFVEGQGLPTYVYKKRAPDTVIDFRTETRFEVLPIILEMKITSAICVPMILEGEVFGVLVGHTIAKREFTEQEISLYQNVANQAAIAIKNSMNINAIGEYAERIRTLTENVPVGINISTPDGRIIEANPAMRRMFGYDSIEEFLKLPASELYCDPEDRKRFIGHLKNGSVKDFEVRLKRKDGSAFWGSIRSIAQARAGGTRFFNVIEDITEHKQAEGLLKESEARYRNVVETSPCSIIIADLNGRILFCNQQTLFSHGFKSMEEALGTNCFELFAPECRERAQVEAQMALKTGGFRNVEYTLIRKDGSLFPVEASASLVVDAEGNPQGFVGMLWDITDRKQAENTLKHHFEIETLVSLLSTSFLKIATDEIDSAINNALKKIGEFEGVDRCYLLEYDMGLSRISNAHEWHTEGIRSLIYNIQGFSPDSFKWSFGKLRRFENVLVPRVADLPEEAGNEKEMAKKVGSRSFLIMPLIYSGSLIGSLGLASVREERTFTEEDMAMLKISGGIMVSAIERVKTEKKLKGYTQELEEKVRKRTAELEREKDYLEKLHNLLGDAVFSVKMPERVIEFANRSVESIFGYKPEEIIGQKTVVLYQDEKGYLDFGKKLNDAIEHGANILHTEHALKRKNGEIFPAEITTTFFKENGENTKVVSIIRDITERNKAAEVLQEAKDMAEAANRAKSEFLANMSHELRTPLNAVIGFSEVIKDGMAGPVTDAQKEYANDILESGRHLLSIISDILDLSRIEAGKEELEITEFPLEVLLKESLMMFNEKAVKHNIKLTTDVAGDIGNIKADARKIKQVVLNLMSNAIKFTPDGGEVGIKASKTEAEVIVMVWDTGIGIKEEDMQRLFMPFVQLEKHLTKKHAGTGLGLMLCKKFVEMHEGKIWAESEFGKGSRFTFTIAR